jgi:hypothetical protein
VHAGAGQTPAPTMQLLLHNSCTTKTNEEHDIQQMFLCHSGFQKKNENIQLEPNNASYQEERMHNDLVPGAVMIPVSSLSKELNTEPNCSISGGHSVNH